MLDEPRATYSFKEFDVGEKGVHRFRMLTVKWHLKLDTHALPSVQY